MQLVGHAPVDEDVVVDIQLLDGVRHLEGQHPAQHVQRLFERVHVAIDMTSRGQLRHHHLLVHGARSSIHQDAARVLVAVHAVATRVARGLGKTAPPVHRTLRL